MFFGPINCKVTPPLHIATIILFVYQLDDVTSQEGIDKLLDEDRYMAVVNSSGWPPTKKITVINKTEFLDGLIRQELISK